MTPPAIIMWLVLLGATLFAIAEAALARSSATRLEELARKKGKLELLERYQVEFELFEFAARLFKVILGGTFILLLYYVLFVGRPGPLQLVGALVLAGVGLWLSSEVLAQLVVAVVGERLTLALLPVLTVICIPFRPLFKMQESLHKVGGRIGGREQAETPEETLAEELRDVVSEGEREGVIQEEEREMIEGVIDLHEAKASAIMTPRTEMVTIPAELSLQQARDLARQEHYSRLPVLSGTRDNIVGMLYVKDLIFADDAHAHELRVQDIMREPYFIPETKPVAHLLREFRTRKLHIAIVLDEYGGTAGVVTIEDILEEIVGEIDDEYDKTEAEEPLKLIDERTAELSARLHIDELNEALGISLPEDAAYETVGGFVFAKLGRIPSQGENFDCDNLHFTVLKGDERSLRRLRVNVKEEEEG